jgi:hypothetical protein
MSDTVGLERHCGVEERRGDRQLEERKRESEKVAEKS